MNGWSSSSDYEFISALHERLNPDLFQLMDQYSHLRPDDFSGQGGRCWVYREGGEKLGYAVAREDGDVPGMCFEEVWCPSGGLADLNVVEWDSVDLKRLEATERLLGQSWSGTGRTYLRASTENSFSALLARLYRYPLVDTLLLSTRRPARMEVQPLSRGYAIRPYRSGDERAYDILCRKCFNERLGPLVFRRWVRQPGTRAYSATFGRHVVGQVTADVRRGGTIGDFNLAVASAHRGKGLGSALLAAAMSHYLASGVRTVVADHWAANSRALTFYRRHGFEMRRSYNYLLVS